MPKLMLMPKCQLLQFSEDNPTKKDIKKTQNSLTLLGEGVVFFK